jgi:hypothetical protein
LARPACEGFAHCELEKRALWQCNACRTQTSLTAGTIFPSTKLDLTAPDRGFAGETTVCFGRLLLLLEQGRCSD